MWRVLTLGFSWNKWARRWPSCQANLRPLSPRTLLFTLLGYAGEGGGAGGGRGLRSDMRDVGIGLFWIRLHALMQWQIVNCDFIKSFIRIHQWGWIRKRSLCTESLSSSSTPSSFPSSSSSFSSSLLLPSPPTPHPPHLYLQMERVLVAFAAAETNLLWKWGKMIIMGCCRNTRWKWHYLPPLTHTLTLTHTHPALHFPTIPPGAS